MTNRRTGNGKEGKAKTKYRGLSTAAAKAPPSVEMTLFSESELLAEESSNRTAVLSSELRGEGEEGGVVVGGREELGAGAVWGSDYWAGDGDGG